MLEYYQNDQNFMLVRDDDGHWYCIPEGKADEFDKWRHYHYIGDYSTAWTGFDFDIARVDHPSRIRFKLWRLM